MSVRRRPPPSDLLAWLEATQPNFVPERLLIVSDDRGFRAKVREAMVLVGHEVVFETDNAADALERIGRGVDFDVAALDMNILVGPDTDRVESLYW